MRSLIVLLFTALALNLAASFAAASCRAESISERAQRADVIAYGRLNGDRFEIRQVLKGSASGTIQVRLQAEKGVVTSVDYMPADGTDQTLYLRLEDGEYVTDACSGSHTGMPDAEERAFFGLNDDAAFWTMGGSVDDVAGGNGQLDGNVTASTSKTVLLGGLAALALASLAAIAAIVRLRRTTT